ncbi:MAG: NAD-dependent epimerase/dehydratase family protein [Egibacteraceae bacterium]
MVTVAVTGTCTALGRAVLQHLRAEKAVITIVGADLVEPDTPVLLDDVDIVVHCALEQVSEHGRAVSGSRRRRLIGTKLTDDQRNLPRHTRSGPFWHTLSKPAADRGEDAVSARTVQGGRSLGGLSLLDGVAKVGARKLVVVSSAAVYGAHPDNELSLAEDAPLRANPDFTSAYQLMLVEQLVEEWADGHPAVIVTVLRPAIMLGPGTEGLMSRHLESPRLPLIRGQSAPLQFVHVDDVAAAVRLAVTTDLPGAFNVAADGWLPMTEVCAILGRRPITFPETTAFEAVRWLWERGLWHMPPGALRYLMYPCVVTADRLQAYGWAPTRSNREILREFVEAHHAHLAIGRLRVRRRGLYVAALAVAVLLVLWLGGRLRARSR